jgi:DNA-binding PadR family transcriptional regulator
LAETFHDRATQELKRGVLQVAVLALLRRRTYGYDLLRVLSERGFAAEEGTLYPVLRRLEGEGLLASEWDTSGSRPRKYYESTDTGRAALSALTAEWSRVDTSLRSVLHESENGHGAKNENGHGE